MKNSGSLLRNVMLLLFNECLRLGCYPWNISFVTPLHKKGSVYDPNNYRAIAVASNIGKLFSSILLVRLLTFRSLFCPDTINQLGFCKNAQTADHILTLSTCITKYTKHKKNGRLYTCFVDFAKAFDTVSREALLYKLWQMGIKGRFFACLEHMYNNSSAKIKLLNKLSQKIDILCGTEQGHPLSPELFKCYIQAMSEQLNEEFENKEPSKVPIMNDVKVSHLLWADDLVLMGQDKTSLQTMLNILHEYCFQWGLTVNMDKTAIMIFSKSGRLLKESNDFVYGSNKILSVREYCYLGITFSLTGSLINAQQKLRQKGLRSYFALKKMVDVGSLRKTVLFKLFDSLIVPVVGYGCQVWLPETHLFRSLSHDASNNSVLQAISKDPLENLHLAFLKWSLGVSRKTSNSPMWGDTGRYPLGIELSKQVFNYFERLKQLDIDDSASLVRHAFCEQRDLNLSWYASLSSAINHQLANGRGHLYPSQLRNQLRKKFVVWWQQERQLNCKLSFYNSIKDEFGTECYLKIWLSRSETRRVAQIRSSSHQLRVETGRYGHLRQEIANRTCQHCCSDDEVYLLSQLPFFDPIIEDEQHFIFACPLYNDVKKHVKRMTMDIISNGETKQLFGHPLHVKEFARYLTRCQKVRFPKEESS